MRPLRILESLAERIESATGLDKPAAALASIIRPAVRPGPVEDTLSGVPLGHPLHPLLVTVPIGAWASAAALDVAGMKDGARILTGLGCLAAVPTAATGGTDWLSTDGPERRIGFVHALANYTAVTAYAASWLGRRRGGRGLLWSGVGGAALGVSGWLGGHLSYAQGVGVDTTAFTSFPTEWTRVGPVPDADGLHRVAVADTAVLVVRRGAVLVAMADRCTHRGGPLHEGTVTDGCVVCPWHGSAFALDDGTVRSGPATRPQPLLETRVDDGVLQVRRVETRTLRENPV